MSGVRLFVTAGLAFALGGCAVIAGYDFGKWGQDPSDGGAGGTGGGGTTSSGSSTSASSSTSTGNSTSTSSSTSASSSTSSGTSSSTSSGACSGTIAGQGVKVAESQSAGIVSVAVDSQNLYWTTGAAPAEPGLIVRAPKTSLMTLNSFGLTPNVLARSLVLDSVNAYWITTSPGAGDAIWQIPKAISQAGISIYSSSAGSYGGLAPGPGVVYFTSAVGGTTFPTAGLYSVSIGGGGLQQLLALPTGETPHEILHDTTTLYFIVAKQTSTFDIRSVVVGSTTATTLAGDEKGATGLVTDGTFLYWSAPGAVHRVPKGGGAVETFGNASLGNCGGLAVDAAYLYCTQTGLGEVFQVPFASPTQPFVSQPVGGVLRGIAVDCTTVYFAAGNQINMLQRL